MRLPDWSIYFYKIPILLRFDLLALGLLPFYDLRGLYIIQDILGPDPVVSYALFLQCALWRMNWHWLSFCPFGG